jgi:hypothetical protein
MVQKLKVLATCFIAISLLFGGCSKTEEEPAAKPVKKSSSRVLVPDDVRGQWKAVRIKVLDKSTSKEETYTIDLGYDFSIAKSDVKIRVETFLPTFVMQGRIMTSASNDLRNPAAEIIVSENNQEIYKGWLFSRFPGTHTFQHERFSFSLVDFIPIKEKKG